MADTQNGTSASGPSGHRATNFAELAADVRARVAVADAEGEEPLGDLEVVERVAADGYVGIAAVVLTPLGQVGVGGATRTTAPSAT